ncbi:MAG: HD domain-containing phosphohydrolase [Thermoanaerobaculia bacterium]
MNPHASSDRVKVPRILAVDDQPENLELLAAILTDEGFEVDFASDGLAALEAVANRPPQAILLDIMMPGLDGFEVCRRIKSTRPTCFIPVVMLTALSDVESKIRGFETGADDFLNKPFHRIELLTRLRSLLRIRSLRDELDSTEALIFSMVHLLEEKDPLTRNHSQRVAAIAAEVGRERRLPARAQYNLTLGALLHDIGRLGVPESILLKPERERTEEDRAIYRLHPDLGERILAPIESLAGAIPYVRLHHERRDGSGYPTGCRGTALSPEIEILAAANAYDMTRVELAPDPETRARSLRQEAHAGRFESALVESVIRSGERLDANGALPTIEDLLPVPEIDPGGRILVADDNATNRQLYRELLSGADYDVETADCGEAALAAYRRNKPDLMILDIRMPDLGGQEVCRIIKADEGSAYLPVILVTAYEERGLRLRSLDSNADELLLAPVNRLELLARVRSLLRLKIYYQDLVRHESVVLSLSAALEAKDPYTRGHSQRVGELSTRLARELGQDAALVARMRTAGLLHDIGKVAIPQALLNKPDRLTAEEFAKLMTHPVVGWEICRPLRTAVSVLDCILYHHERFDGRGYPEGLAGNEIPYQARLLAVADALDALTSERAYRHGLSVDEAVQLLGAETKAGKWDPEIFAALTRLASRGEVDPRRFEIPALG